MSKIKLIILATVFVDVIGVSVVIPILPFYAESFGLSSVAITALFSVFALCSFLSAPLLGAFSDRLGRRPMFILSIFSTALGWAVFASAHNAIFLFVGRIIDGLAAGNLSIAQTYMSDLAKDEKERAQNLGLVGMIFGIAFIIGPFLGGALATVSHAFPFWFVSALALANTVLAFFFLPETKPLETEKRALSFNPFLPLGRAWQAKKLRPNYVAWFLFAFGLAIYQAIFALYMQERFAFNEFAIGLIFAFSGVIIALNQGLFMRRVWLRYFSQTVLELGAMFIFVLGMILFSLPYVKFMFFILLVTTFCQSILRVVMMSQIVSEADPSERGEVMGVTASIASVSMGVAPILGGYLFGFQSWYPFLFAAFVFFIAFLILLLKYRQQMDQRSNV